MLTIELSFPAGRYHGTPWGRNVNEGVPEWPPSPYRILRAIYDTWKRKRPEWPDSRVGPILHALASAPPLFYLPPATTSHTRAYLSSNEKDISKKQKIFDAFVVLAPASAVILGWSDLTLPEIERNDLNELLHLMNYLGRSESWVEAHLLNGKSRVDWNCIPARDYAGEQDGEVVKVACALSSDEYQRKRESLQRKLGRRELPEWFEAIAWSTSELHKYRLSDPPALQYVEYFRPKWSTDESWSGQIVPPENLIQAVLYAMESKVPPRVIETLEIAERVRRKLMGIHARIKGEKKEVSSRFSGKDQNGSPLKGHRHAFFLPQDRDRDGRIDHMLILCRDGFDRSEQAALDAMHSLWQTNGRDDIRCVPLRWGNFIDLCTPATRLMSATPFVPPRHHRKGRGEFGSGWKANYIVRL